MRASVERPQLASRTVLRPQGPDGCSLCRISEEKTTKKKNEIKKEWKKESERASGHLCFEQQTGAWVRRRGVRLEVYMCSLPLNQGTGWINNTIDIPVMRSRRTIHNYFIVAVMRASALLTHPALAGRPLLKPGPRGKKWTSAAPTHQVQVRHY